MLGGIRVLVVDDSAVVRRIVSDVISEDPALAVISTAANGKIAMTRIAESVPDAVVLDFEMPEMGGLETITAIRAIHPRLPIIMLSTMTRRGAAATLDAIAEGANDYITKPSSVTSSDALEYLRAELLPRIKAFCTGVRSAAPRTVPVPSAPAPAANVVAFPAASAMPPEVILIGVSTGGPKALEILVPQLKGLPVPVLIVQHMPAVFTKLLAERLAVKAGVPVREATAGAVAKPGDIWIAPGDYHLAVARDPGGVRLNLNQESPENSVRPAVDVLFRTGAAAFGNRCLAVVMTGMGQDGLIGAKAVRSAGGQILTQDEATSVVWGMPGVVTKAGLASQVMPLDRLAAEIAVRTRRGAAPRVTTFTPQSVADRTRRILATVR